MHPEETRVYFAVLTLSCISIALVVFYVIVIIKHQQKKSGANTNASLQEFNLIEAERGRIGLNLHDSVNYAIISVKLKLSGLSLPEESQQRILEEADSSLESLAHTLRDISQQLMPVVLQRYGLKAAIEDLFSPLYQSHRYQIDFSWDANGCSLSPETALHMYRIIQEMINNIVKHARANRIEMVVSQTKRYLVFDIRDDGCGFDEQTVSANQSLGLRSIRMRADLIGARIYKSKPTEKGTHFHVEVPAQENGKKQENR